MLKASDPGKPATGRLNFGGGAAFTNNGVFIADERVEMTGTAGCCTPPAANFDNTGVFTAAAPGGTPEPGITTIRSMGFRAGGTVHVESGSLELRSGAATIPTGSRPGVSAGFGSAVTRAAAKTGSGPTVMVAIEQHFPGEQRIVDDDLAGPILPFGMRAYVNLMRLDAARDWMVRVTERRLPGLWGAMMCRKRYIDEKLIEAAGHVSAVVNLGAGLDTRAYRLPALAGVPVWELNLPENVEPKRARLRKLFGAVPAHVDLVPVDFDRADLGTVLSSHGYAANERTFFVWEAVSQYLTESGVRATFDFLARAVRGSRLAFTYVRSDFLDGRVMYGVEELHRKYVSRDKVWLFGMAPEDVESFLGAYGWSVVEHLGYEELAERYVKPTGRELASTPIERMVYALKL